MSGDRCAGGGDAAPARHLAERDRPADAVGGEQSDQATLVEHHGPDQNQSDPDFQARASGNPASYEAIRTPNAVYVEYRNGDREYYDLVGDPHELDNTYAELSPARQARLHDALAQLEGCSGSDCWVTTPAAG